MTTQAPAGSGDHDRPGIRDCYQTAALREWGQFLDGVRLFPALSPFALGAKFMVFLAERGWIPARNGNAGRLFKQSIVDYRDGKDTRENPLALFGRVASQYGKPALEDLAKNDKYIGITYRQTIDYLAHNPEIFRYLDSVRFADTQNFRNGIHDKVMDRRTELLLEKYNNFTSNEMKVGFWDKFLEIEFDENSHKLDISSYCHHSLFSMFNIALRDGANESSKRAAKQLVAELLKFSEVHENIREALAQPTVSGELTRTTSGGLHDTSRFPNLAAALDEMVMFSAPTRTVADYPGALMKMVPAVAKTQHPIRLLDDTTAPDPADTLH